MSMSPWAMLITRMTPNVIARPSAVRMRIELRLMLLERAASRSVVDIRGYFSSAPGSGGREAAVRQRPRAPPDLTHIRPTAGTHFPISTFMPFLTPPDVQSQLQPGKAKSGYGLGAIHCGVS